MRIMDKASVGRFQKPFQNMRASCETNWLVLGIPESQVSEWIGHAVKVGRKHYHQARESWAKLVTEGDEKAQQKAQHSLTKATQKAQQHEAAQDGIISHEDQKQADSLGNCDVERDNAELCGSGAMNPTPRVGLEPTT
jgi:vacuolar-type H+-ATPase subunit H